MIRKIVNILAISGYIVLALSIIAYNVYVRSGNDNHETREMLGR